MAFAGLCVAFVVVIDSNDTPVDFVQCAKQIIPTKVLDMYSFPIAMSHHILADGLDQPPVFPAVADLSGRHLLQEGSTLWPECCAHRPSFYFTPRVVEGAQ